jgi:hypothetical protein
VLLFPILLLVKKVKLYHKDNSMDAHTTMIETINAVRHAAKAMKPPIELTNEQAKEFIYNLELERVRIYPIEPSTF